MVTSLWPRFLAHPVHARDLGRGVLAGGGGGGVGGGTACAGGRLTSLIALVQLGQRLAQVPDHLVVTAATTHAPADIAPDSAPERARPRQAVPATDGFSKVAGRRR